jgi:hypothetical protein
MRRILVATTAIAALGMGTAIAQEAPVAAPNAPAAERATLPNDWIRSAPGQAAGVGTGATLGAATGAVIGGPVGAVVGGVAGGLTGAAAVPGPAVTYVAANPVPRTSVGIRVAPGTVLPGHVALHPIPDYPEYRYVYTDTGPVIVRSDTRRIVRVIG